jgi:predicted nucleic acid-binding protein
MAAKYKLHDVSQLQNRDIFVDANVLIYLFWPTGSYAWEQSYARVFRDLLRQKNSLFVDFSVISEIINRTLRIEHEKKQPCTKLKDFRNSLEGKNTLSDIYLIVKTNILSRFTVIGKAFGKQDIEQFLVVNDLDFVDKSILTICKENALVLLTNDRDFKNADIDILTGNPMIHQP